eukprot:866545_1
MDVDEAENISKEENTSPTIIEQYPFGEFCRFLEAVSSQSKSNKKRELCEQLWTRLKCKGGKHWFPLMRLLLPQLDLERGGYGIKEKKMGDLYLRAIPLSNRCKDAKKIKTV